MRYVAFLRGINVSGQKLIKMEALSTLFSSLGFKEVKTILQSGNVVFETSEKDLRKIENKIEKGLVKKLGEVRVFARTVEQMQKLVKLDPFSGKSEESHRYVTFLNAPFTLDLPLFSPKKDVEVFAAKEGALFCIPHEINGRYGFPNVFIEAKLKVPATTRNWKTILKVAFLE